MNLQTQAKNIHSAISSTSTKMGDLKKMAKELKINHPLALELWSTGDYLSRLLAVLIMDKKLLSQDFLDMLDRDLKNHTSAERNHIMEWLLANQLMKDKRTIALVQNWDKSLSPMQRRTYWYYQARVRWMGQTHHHDTAELVSMIEESIAAESPEVQWAMNFTAGWIGVYEEKYRSRCMEIGKKTGLYKDEVVSRGCTPNYLPEFIAIEVEKRKK